MRVQIEEEEFSQWLLKLGSGTLPVKPEDPLRGCIETPEQCFLSDNESIVEKIFGGAEEADYAKRAILMPTNVDSLAIYEEVLHRLPGDVKTYLSSDSIDTDDLNEINNFPVEFLNSLTPSCMPVHCLKLKIGAVIMLLRNLDLKGGLCNGTRLMVRALHNNYIDGEVLTGVSAGNRVFVPRVQLAPSDANLPFTPKRRQFPVWLAYSMTINKSQGQTIEKVGVILKSLAFHTANYMLHVQEQDHLIVCFSKLINIHYKVCHLTNITQIMLSLQMFLIYNFDKYIMCYMCFIFFYVFFFCYMCI
ncbi:uncharacterized protein LOC136094412 [Hydra vulgaris]|uniref:uncharacterized protein LOC136094412 n=1 Tax=Hydra vulgaris TaxID=6087 RepID=UPI0032E9F7B5